MKKFISKLHAILILIMISNLFGIAQTIPTWLNGKPLNEWFEIPNTSGGGGAAVDAWGGWAIREDSSQLFFAASGGHSDSYDNRVVSIKLADNAPKWILRCAPTPFSGVSYDVSHYADGNPSSRHIYQYNLWVPAVNRVMMFGLYGTWPNAWNYPTVDGFNPTTNTWDPAGTWSNVQGGFGAVRESNSSVVWTQGLNRWDPNTDTYSTPITSRTNTAIRFPVAHDTKRGQLFTLQIGDGQGYSLNLGLQSSRIPLSGNQQLNVTFNNSPALTQFLADSPTYSAMDYDPENDRFLFYCGQGTGTGRIYVITPNSGNVWDISILTLGPGSVTPVVVPGSGINRRFSYVPALKGFVMLPRQSSNLYFIRTAPIVPTEVSNDKVLTKQITLFPNPFNTSFILKISSETTLKNAAIKIYDTYGRQVKMVSVSRDETVVSRDELSNGIYFYTVINDNAVMSSGKLIIQ
ncbi:MAG: T9SS type A sorting domain-containing protein [Bacteroidota bacterium]